MNTNGRPLDVKAWIQIVLAIVGLCAPPLVWTAATLASHASELRYHEIQIGELKQALGEVPDLVTEVKILLDREARRPPGAPVARYTPGAQPHPNCPPCPPKDKVKDVIDRLRRHNK